MLKKKNILNFIFKFFIILFFIFGTFSLSYAKIIISEVFPNTIDDKNLEYIELKNTGNNIVNLNNFFLKDKSGKKYIFNENEKLKILEEKKFFRKKTKIILNNTKEEIFLYNNLGKIIDSFSYKTSKKGEKIIISYLEENIDNSENNEKIDENFLENIGNIFDNENKNIVYRELKNIDCEAFLKQNNFKNILEEINNGNEKKLEEEYKKYCLENNENLGKNMVLPEIILEFQRPSYILNLDNLDENKFFYFTEKLQEKKFFCDKTKQDCKINFNLEKSFSHEFLEKNYICEINFGKENKNFLNKNLKSLKGYFLDEENNIILEKCNPSSIFFLEGETDISFKILEKNNKENFTVKSIKIINQENKKEIEKEETKKEEENKKENFEKEEKKVKNIEEINILTPKIIIQSGLDEQKKCKNTECNINLIYEIKNKREKCLWNFGKGISKKLENKNNCNPSYVKFSNFGKFEIKLKVYDELNPKNFKEKILYFENIENIKKTEKQDQKQEKKEIITQEKIEENIKKENALEKNIEEKYEKQKFYIFLQGKIKKNILWEHSKINYFTTKNGAKINFGLKFENKKHLRNIKYEWKMGNEFHFYKKNPKTHFFSIGRHYIMVFARYKGKIIAQDSLVLNIIKKEKLEKKKLKKLKKEKLEKIIIKDKKFKKFKKIKKQKIFKTKTKIIKNHFKKNKILKNFKKKNIEKNVSKQINLDDLKIVLQGKKTDKKIFENNKIICYTKKNCKLNLSLEGIKNKKGFEYFWNFGNGKIFNKKNPKTVDFEIGNYKLNLDIFYNGKKLKTQKIEIFVYKQGKSKKIISKKNKNLNKKSKNIKNKKNKKSNKIFFIKTVNASYNNNFVEKDNIFSKILTMIIFIFFLYLVFILIQKEGFLEEEK